MVALADTSPLFWCQLRAVSKQQLVWLYMLWTRINWNLEIQGSSNSKHNMLTTGIFNATTLPYGVGLYKRHPSWTRLYGTSIDWVYLWSHKVHKMHQRISSHVDMCSCWLGQCHDKNHVIVFTPKQRHIWTRECWNALHFLIIWSSLCCAVFWECVQNCVRPEVDDGTVVHSLFDPASFVLYFQPLHYTFLTLTW